MVPNHLFRFVFGTFFLIIPALACAATDELVGAHQLQSYLQPVPSLQLGCAYRSSNHRVIFGTFSTRRLRAGVTRFTPMSLINFRQRLLNPAKKAVRLLTQNLGSGSSGAQSVTQHLLNRAIKRLEKLNTVKDKCLVFNPTASSQATPTPQMPPLATPTSTPTPTPTSPCDDYTIHWQMYSPNTIPTMNPGNFPHVTKGHNVSFSEASGLVPLIDLAGHATNGGIPPLGNLPAHVNAFGQAIAFQIPDPNSTGLAVLDWESWGGGPQWARANDPYRARTLDLVRSQHPEMTSAQVEAAAKELWETTVTEWYLATIHKIKHDRPGWKVGAYYLIPPSTVYEDPYWGPISRAMNDDPVVTPIYEALDFMVADPYLSYKSFNNGYPQSGVGQPPYGVWYSWNEAFVRMNIEEPLRVGDRFGGKPVYTYAWPRYGGWAGTSYPYGLTEPSDIFVQLIYPGILGIQQHRQPGQSRVAGVFLWGWEEVASWSQEISNFQQTTMGPMIEDFCAGTLTSWDPARYPIAAASGGDLGS